MSIQYRLVKQIEYQAVADLHANSWQEHYRGICSDHYLDHEVVDDRAKVWADRRAAADPKMHLLGAYDGKDLIGFVCTFLDYHVEWGAYLDNLHVASSHQKKGIGLTLMRHAAQYVAAQRPDSRIYLHVIKENAPAINFYEKIGGKTVGEYEIEVPWGGLGVVYDYLWEVEDLI